MRLDTQHLAHALYLLSLYWWYRKANWLGCNRLCMLILNVYSPFEVLFKSYSLYTSVLWQCIDKSSLYGQWKYSIFGHTWVITYCSGTSFYCMSVGVLGWGPLCSCPLFLFLYMLIIKVRKTERKVKTESAEDDKSILLVPGMNQARQTLYNAIQ